MVQTQSSWRNKLGTFGMPTVRSSFSISEEQTSDSEFLDEFFRLVREKYDTLPAKKKPKFLKKLVQLGRPAGSDKLTTKS